VTVLSNCEQGEQVRIRTWCTEVASLSTKSYSVALVCATLSFCVLHFPGVSVCLLQFPFALKKTTLLTFRFAVSRFSGLLFLAVSNRSLRDPKSTAEDFYVVWMDTEPNEPGEHEIQQIHLLDLFGSQL
jgi:hypothetical protein